MTENISILGSTGSIGTQTLDVVREIGGIKVWAMSTNTRISLKLSVLWTKIRH